MEKVSRLVSTDNSDLLNVTIRLLLNLSFDAGLRAKMIKVGLLPKLVSHMCKYFGVYESITHYGCGRHTHSLQNLKLSESVFGLHN